LGKKQEKNRGRKWYIKGRKLTLLIQGEESLGHIFVINLRASIYIYVGRKRERENK
jgi:hypothetical protein